MQGSAPRAVSATTDFAYRYACCVPPTWFSLIKRLRYWCKEPTISVETQSAVNCSESSRTVAGRSRFSQSARQAKNRLFTPQCLAILLKGLSVVAIATMGVRLASNEMSLVSLCESIKIKLLWCLCLSTSVYTYVVGLCVWVYVP